MWREFIQTFTENAHFSEPASSAELAEVEQAVGMPLPQDLRSLLQETNGLDVSFRFAGLENEAPLLISLIWSTHEIIEKNTMYHSFDEGEKVRILTDLYFFASEPNGDPIAFPFRNGRADETSTVTISHEDYRDRRVEAWSLRDYLTCFLDFV